MPLTKVSYSMIDGAVLNVKDFGAVGNGIADDTAAIQLALSQLRNGVIFFPAGSYKVSATLKIEYNAVGTVGINLVGEGLGSIINWSGSDNVPVIWYEATSNLQGFFSKTFVKNLHFINSINANGSQGIKLGNFSSPLGMGAGIQNFTVQGCKFASFDFCVWTEYESDTILIQDNVFLSYKQRALYMQGSADVTVADNYFQFGEAGSTAIYGETASYTIIGNLIQSSKVVAGAIVLSKSGSFTITGNFIEFPIGNQFAILLQSTSSGEISNNSFQGMQGIDVIVIDSVSRDVNIGINTYGFFGFPISSFVKADPGAVGVSVLGNQDYSTLVAISNGSPAIITSVANSPGWQLNQRVFFTTAGTLPAGLTAYTEYFIVNPSGITFQVAATSSGSPLATSSSGSGTHTVHIVLDVPFDGNSAAFDFQYNNAYLTFGTPQYVSRPNPGITMAKSGVLNIGNNAGGSGWGFVTFNRSGVNVGVIQQSGTTGVLYSTASDYRLKENVQPMQNALEKVALLKPVTYTWKADGSNGQGFLAHELQAVIPDCVTGQKDQTRNEQYEIEPAVYEEVVFPASFDQNGKLLTPERKIKRLTKPALVGERQVSEYQGIDTSFLVATLAKAIQELKAEFDAYRSTHP